MNINSASDCPKSFSAWHLYVPSAERVISGICSERVFRSKLVRVRFGMVVSSLAALYHLMWAGGCAGAEQTRVISRIFIEGVHLACMPTLGESEIETKLKLLHCSNCCVYKMKTRLFFVNLEGD